MGERRTLLRCYRRLRAERCVVGDFLHPALITPQSGQALNDLLTDPQKMNFYSYVQNNPLKNTNSTGKQARAMGGSW